MAHDVEITEDGTAHIFSVRNIPWHGLGDILPEYPKSREELITAAHFSPVEKRPVKVELADGSLVESGSHSGIVRVSDGKLLSIMGINYEASGADEIALVDFTLALMDVNPADMGIEVDGDIPIKFTNGGHLADGKKAWLCYELPKNVKIGDLDSEAVRFFGFAHTSYDGSWKFGTAMSGVRVVCANTAAAAFSSAAARWSTKHTKNAKSRIDEARRTLKLAYKYADTFEAEMNELLNAEFTKGQFETMVRDLFPKTDKNDPAPFSREQYSLIGLLESSPTLNDDVRYTKWGAFNAVTEYQSWGRRFNGADQPDGEVRIAERRTESALFGKGADAAQKAFDYLTTVK
jgi:phage/plasmid-like protein (TIGR03299 family)